MEKSVEACQIRLNIDDSLLEIIVKCRSGNNAAVDLIGSVPLIRRPGENV